MRVKITLAEDVDLSQQVVVAHPVFEAPCKIDASELMWQLAEQTIPSSDLVLGCTYDANTNKAVFNIWAPSSTSVVLNLYNKDGLKSLQPFLKYFPNYH